VVNSQVLSLSSRLMSAKFVRRGPDVVPTAALTESSDFRGAGDQHNLRSPANKVPQYGTSQLTFTITLGGRGRIRRTLPRMVVAPLPPGTSDGNLPPPGAGCQILITFTPGSYGTWTSSLVVPDGVGISGKQTVALSSSNLRQAAVLAPGSVAIAKITTG
jgi:hypothetical protein